MKAGDFPKPIRISANRMGWLESAVNDWIASKMEAA
jgi:predicted DNA-binding transcriptional regulator AlpA